MKGKGRGGWPTHDLHLRRQVVVGTEDVFRFAVRRSCLELVEEIAIYCPNCGAQTKIRRGTTKQCEYCGGYITAPKG